MHNVGAQTKCVREVSSLNQHALTVGMHVATVDGASWSSLKKRFHKS